ncbi:nucleoside triphosphate pyrophosphohydrolase [Acrocarpospora phusangensis]|uniref:Nucleoside triphosphate pyrophosphohydrolase n=1 Tax=Acrocarpospora phusangensis TaxID=1070424 RepID=A0A919QDE1_9ACTN|nr:MazG family protein [Acrocarpospora phusangensis]GIH25393.1 nucleoside triphosphate pyrophosphohydrolase [Acrocarpospora phusangensis]
MPLIIVTTSPRVAPGLLTERAWAVLRNERVLTGSADHPVLPYLEGVSAEVRTDPAGVAAESRDGVVVWLAAQDGDEAFLRAVGHAALAMPEPPEIELVPGSYDLPGARVLDMVTVMDRLRRECPWDGKQTHESLVPYLLEEAYEVLETIEAGDYPALREELGDLLFQVVFHARVAQEREDGFDIDDVAGAIVDKLVRRHPHVFAGLEVADADEVNANWEAIKRAERAAKGDSSPLDGVPMGQPALSLAAQLLRRGGDQADFTPEGSELGLRLFALVREARAAGLDPEAELRQVARAYKAHVESGVSTGGRNARTGE